MPLIKLTYHDKYPFGWVVVSSMHDLMCNPHHTHLQGQRCQKTRNRSSNQNQKPHQKVPVTKKPARTPK